MVNYKILLNLGIIMPILWNFFLIFVLEIVLNNQLFVLIMENFKFELTSEQAELLSEVLHSYTCVFKFVNSKLGHDKNVLSSPYLIDLDCLIDEFDIQLTSFSSSHGCKD